MKVQQQQETKYANKRKYYYRHGEPGLPVEFARQAGKSLEPVTWWVIYWQFWVFNYLIRLIFSHCVRADARKLNVLISSGEELCNSPCCLFDNMMIFRCNFSHEIMIKHLWLRQCWNQNIMISLYQKEQRWSKIKYKLKYSISHWSVHFNRADNWTALTNVRLLRRE